MSDTDTEAENVDWQELEESNDPAASPDPGELGESSLEAIYDVPVRVSAVLGKTNLQVSKLLQLGPGAVLELDRKVGEAVDIFVNNRLVARGEVVLVDEKLGITMTEIIKTED
jgi:flagellar motor switch protein FliN/FliY